MERRDELRGEASLVFGVTYVIVIHIISKGIFIEYRLTSLIAQTTAYAGKTATGMQLHDMPVGSGPRFAYLGSVLHYACTYLP